MAGKLEDAAATMAANLEKNTGKSLDQWAALAGKSGKEKHGELVKWLKGEHDLTHGYANLVAHRALKSDAASVSETTDLVAAQYSGDKAALKPIYDAVLKAAKTVGAVEVAPKKAYVSLRRDKQFAIIQPSTKTRVDLGLNIKDAPFTERLEKAGSFNSMVSHRVRLEKPGDVDKNVRAWLAEAWKQAGE